jgi:type I restriction-modification system DNA methylase subunit
VRVLDPACGSGAFLVEAFDQLQDRYEEAIERLVELTNQPSLFDLTAPSCSTTCSASI